MNDSATRKATPIFSGVMRYFPNALAAVARLSKIGNDKHNPGEPLHWARDKSTDHGDCIARHQITFDQIDPESGEYHAAGVAWRALAQLELLEEKRLLDALSGPQGRVQPQMVRRQPEAGEEWEPGPNEGWVSPEQRARPAWASSEITLVDYRNPANHKDCGTERAGDLGWYSDREYRKHQG